MKIIVSPGPSFTSNPFFVHFNESLRKRGHEIAGPTIRKLFFADIFHINFPEHMITESKSVASAIAAGMAMLFFMLVQKLRGKKIIWTVHDVHPLRPKYPRLCSVYMTLVRSMVDGQIFLSSSSRMRFSSTFHQRRERLVLELFHPVFPVDVLSKEKRTELRKRLGFKDGDYVVGFLGDIKPYKNPGIIEFLPSKLGGGQNVVLLVAGSPDGADTTQFEKILASRRNVRINRRLNDRELEDVIQAVDVVLLSYLYGWNSGFLFLILSCEQKVLSSNLEIFEEMKIIFGEAWIRSFDLATGNIGPSITVSLNAVAAQEPNSDDVERLRQYVSYHSFDHFAERVDWFYQCFA